MLNGEGEQSMKQSLEFRDFFYQLTQSGKLLIVHNGLLDLMFLYHSFFANLPNNLATFVVNLNDLFKGGIVDTKFMSEYLFRDDASFLSYLFRKW
jgi:target of EGR1 protein 1